MEYRTGEEKREQNTREKGKKNGNRSKKTVPEEKEKERETL